MKDCTSSIFWYCIVAVILCIILAVSALGGEDTALAVVDYGGGDEERGHGKERKLISYNSIISDESFFTTSSKSTFLRDIPIRYALQAKLFILLLTFNFLLIIISVEPFGGL